MREHISAASVANAIRMKRTQLSGAFLVVEGPTDKKVLSTIVDRHQCHMEIAHGRENVLSAIDILNDDHVPGIVGIIDADIGRISGTLAYSQSNVFVTDLHDLECTMIQSPAFERVVREFGNDERLDDFTDQPARMGEILAERCVPIGCLRLISAVNGYGLDFDKLSFDKFVDDATLQIYVPLLVREVVNRSHRHELESQLLAGVQGALEERHDVWQVVCGHDVMELLSVGLRKRFAGYNSREVSRELLERSLRIAFDPEHLKKMDMFQKIREWEISNPDFKVWQ